MTTLQELQEKFQDYLLGTSQAMLPNVIETPEVSAETRLGIYKNGYAARLIEVLESDFSSLHTLLGDEGFHQLCHEYVQAHPSVYRSVRWFAGHLAGFLRDHLPYQQYPVLAEMAEFEWTLQAVLDAANADSLSVEEMGAIPPEQWGELRFDVHPALRRLDVSWNVPAIWQAVESDKTPPEIQKLEFPIPWMFWRSEELQVLFRSMAVDEAWALDALIEGRAFAGICEGLCEWVDEEHAGMRAAELLKGWILQGIISRVQL